VNYQLIPKFTLAAKTGLCGCCLKKAIGGIYRVLASPRLKDKHYVVKAKTFVGALHFSELRSVTFHALFSGVQARTQATLE